jgi:two-component sensor histidine kinase
MSFDFNPDFITSKCKEHTLLDDDEIKTIIDVARVLPYFGESHDSEVFIDILDCKEDKAIVVAEYYKNMMSIYKNTFMGDAVYRENEPAVFRTFDMGVVTKDVVGVSYDKIRGKIWTKQTVLPIVHNKNVVATLIFDKALNVNSTEMTDFETKDIELSGGGDVSETILSILGFNTEYDESIGIKKGILIFNLDGYLSYYNKYADNIYKEFGYKFIDSLHFDKFVFVSKLLDDILSEAANKNMEDGKEISTMDTIHVEAVSIKDKHYNVRIVLSKSFKYKIIVIIDDITEINKYKDAANDYLISNREINHRIKNNLQTIASLLRLQGRSSNNITVKSFLSDSINRILSIAVTHELLAQKGNNVSVKELLDSIKRNHDLSKVRNIEIIINGVDYQLDSEKATVIAMVVNELVQNSIKYAFEGRNYGRIEINSASDGHIKVIEVKDNGIGYDVNKVRKDSLGLTIVDDYVTEKLAGKLIVNTGKEGTSTSFTFKP